MAKNLGWFNLRIDPTSTRCEYCAGCDHCTIECPGLRHDVPSVRALKERVAGFTPPEQQAAFDARMVAAGQAKPCECNKCDTAKAAEPNCSKCGELSHAGRPLFPVDLVPDQLLICGDCISGGTPLTKQPVKEPEPIHYHAWATPSWEDVG